MSSSADEAVLLKSLRSPLPKRRVFTPPRWVGFWATLTGAAIGVCAATVGVFLLFAYLAGTGASG
jgi:hypothetical protein